MGTYKVRVTANVLATTGHLEGPGQGGALNACGIDPCRIQNTERDEEPSYERVRDLKQVGFTSNQLLIGLREMNVQGQG